MYSFRFATAEDIDAIVALVESAYRGESSRAGWTTEADLLGGQRTDSEEVERLIKRPSSYILLCEQQGQLLATVHLLQQPHQVILGMFAVSPGQQAKGIGSCLLAEAEKHVFQEWKLGRLQMYVIAQRKELIAWYQRRGYLVTDEVKSFPYGDVRYGIPKRDDLYLQVLEKRTASL